MASTELIEWIKSEQVRKLSDENIRKSLLKKGWVEKDVNVAIDLTHKGKVNWLPVLIFFIISIVLYFIGIIYNVYFDQEYMIFIFFIVALIYTLFIYFKSHKSESFITYLIIHLTALEIALFTSTLIFNLLTLFVYLTKLKITIPLIILFLIIAVIFLFYLFFILTARLSTHFLGYFDEELYFQFKHIPFKLLNTDYKRKWTLLKYPLTVIVIGLIIFGVIMMLSVNSSMQRTIDNTGNTIKQQMESQLLDTCYNNLWQNENISIKEHRVYSINKQGNNYFYEEDLPFEVNTIFYNCNFKDKKCSSKPYDYSKRLEDQMNLPEGFNVIIKIQNKQQVILVEPHQYSSEELVSCSYFNNEQLKLEIIQEIDKQRKELWLNALKKQTHFNIENSFYSSFKTINNFDTSLQASLNAIQLGLDSGLWRTQSLAIEDEFSAIKKFKSNQSFYDSTLSLNEHINRLNENINNLYPMYLSTKKNPSFTSFYNVYEEYSYTNILSFTGSFDYLFGNWYRFKEFSEKISKLQENYMKDKIADLYAKKAIFESPESKTIRLKIIERLLAQEIIRLDLEMRSTIGIITKDNPIHQ